MLRPSSSLPFMDSMASFIAFSSANVTNPKPLLRPVSRSLMIFDSTTSPKTLKASSRRLSLVAHARPPTKHLYSAPDTAAMSKYHTPTNTLSSYNELSNQTIDPN
ncbi:hypothetical protein Mapa_013763 [Marchantia paleacea]|nr:hypothetical protein Mapa_013763 [Marchantia paleacea]